MFTHPFQNFVYLDGNRAANIREGILVELPEDWVIKHYPGVGLFGYDYVFGVGQQGNDGEPQIAVRRFNGLTSIDQALSFLRAKARSMLSEPCSIVLAGATATSIDCIDHNNRMRILLVERKNGVYGIELWSETPETYEDTLKRFAESIDWNYVHEPRSKGSSQEGIPWKLLRLIITIGITYIVCRALKII
jgi:hypothetical protein